MRNIETFPSKQMYPYLSLVESKAAEFYLNIDRMRWLVLAEMIYFRHFFWTIPGVLGSKLTTTNIYSHIHGQINYYSSMFMGYMFPHYPISGR